MQKFIDTVLVQNSSVLSLSPVVGATVTVKLAGTQTLASVFSDNGVTAINQSTSPITTDSNGTYQFYAPNGRYDLVITASGITAITKSDIIIDDLVTFIGGNYANNTGTANSLVATMPSAPQSTLVDGYPLTLDMGGRTNAGIATLQVTLNGTSTPTYPVVKSSGLGLTPLLSGDLPQRALFSFDAPTNSWVLLNPVGGQQLKATSQPVATASVPTPIVTLTLTPGTWMVSGYVSYTAAANTAYGWIAGISQNTLTVGTLPSIDIQTTPVAGLYGGVVKSQQCAADRITVAPNTTSTVALVAVQLLTAGTGTATGTITAQSVAP